MSRDLIAALSIALAEAQPEPGLLALAREDLDCIFARDPAARSRLEVVLCYPGFHALLFYRVANAAWRHGWTLVGRFLSHVGRVVTGIEIHPGATIGRRVFIDHGMGVVIGETAVIEDECTLYHGVTLGGTSWNMGKRHPTLQRGVVIGAGAKVLGPITLGKGAKVGSNAVVVRDVPPGATAVGIPARVIEDRSEIDREVMAGQMGFSAYAVTRAEDDPLAQAIHGLLNHAVETDRRIEALLKTMERAGVSMEDDVATADKFDPNYLSKIVD